jgi:hypothetical protein
LAPLSRSELLLMEFYPTAFQAAIRISSEHANGASSTYHGQLDTGYLHPRDQRSVLSRWDRLSRVS